MRNAILAAAVVGVGFVTGFDFVGGASPWTGLAPSAATAQTAAEAVATGSFRDADASHRGSGMATIVQSPAGAVLRLSEFEVTDGPDLEVWLVKATGIQNSDDVKGSEWVSLGQLASNTGDQEYAIPEGTNIADYPSVVIWCEDFGVLFSTADMSPAS